MKSRAETISRESARIISEYQRRETEISKDLYAPWQAAENFILAERKARAAHLLFHLGKFPQSSDSCLEIGYGKIGWLADLISWGVSEKNLHGIELSAERAGIAQNALPSADLRVGSATLLPWANNFFRFVIVSTVFSSILDSEIRKMIVAEIERVLMREGVVIFYDLAVGNPRNKNVEAVKAGQIKEIFPNFAGEIKRLTLAPPVARFAAPKSFALAALLNALPFLRTHLLAILVKK